MRYGRNCAAAATLITLLTRCAWGSPGSDAIVTFDTPGDLANNFNSSATLPYAEADDVGIGSPATRGLSLTGTNDAASTFKTSSLPFDTVGSQLAISMFFHTQANIGTSGENRVMDLEFASLNTAIITSAHSGVGARIVFPAANSNIAISFRRDNSDVAGSVSPSTFAILPSHWYKATMTITNQGTASPIPASMVLDDYDSDGLTLLSPNVISYSFNIPAEATVTADPDVFGAFRARNASRLYNALDQFEQVQVPEPAAVVICIVPALATVFGRRGRLTRSNRA